MAIKKIYSRGFTLLIATIFMSVMLMFGLALASLSYKQQMLASSAIESQYAFYAADSGLECALYADQQQNLFAYTPPPIPPAVDTAPSINCRGVPPFSTSVISHTNSQWVVFNRINLDSVTRCVDVTIYKPDPAGGGPTYLFSQGYDVSCATVTAATTNPNAAPRMVTRGLTAHY
jgi:Tfp pilus assembly protein PilX